MSTTKVSMAPARPERYGEQMLVIINYKTDLKEVKDAISEANRRGLGLTVIYTAKPVFVTDQTNSAEVDDHFLERLQKGRSVLDSIAFEAKSRGVDVSTSFVWSESPNDVAAEYGNTVAYVVDRSA